jgi:hypothetical protein
MSSILSSVTYRPQNSAPQHANPYTTQTRTDKTRELFSQVIPSAIEVGLQGFEVAGAVSQGGAIAASSTTSAAQAGTLGMAGSAAGIAGGLYGAYDLIANWGASTPARGASSGMAVGATVGTMIGGPGFGTAIGAAIGTVAGGVIGAITAGKHKDQKIRDEMREALVQNGILDSNYQLQLADGSTYNMGLDGGPRAEFGGRRPFEVDFSNPLAKYAVSWMNPIIEVLAQGNKKLQTDFVGYFANAAMSNAKTLEDVANNINSFMQRFGITHEALAKAVIQAAQNGQLDRTVAEAYINGIQQLANPSLIPDLARQPTPVTSAPQGTGGDVVVAEDAALL